MPSLLDRHPRALHETAHFTSPLFEKSNKVFLVLRRN